MAKAQTAKPNAKGPASTATAAGQGNKDWDEARVQSALARVQELHAQLRKLRTTVPSLLAPIHAEHTSPETLFVEFRSAATDAVNNVRNFQTKMRDPKTKEILERAKESKQEKSDGIKSWIVSQHEDWLDQPTLRSANDLQTEDIKQEDDKADQKDKPTISQAVQKFKADHPDVTMTLKEEQRIITMNIPAPANLNFHISWSASTNPTFEAKAKQNSNMVQNMNQCLAKRPKADDLPYTLEMLMAYSDIRKRRCDGCNKLLSFAKEFTSVRVGIPSTTANGSPTHTWKAYHPGCPP